VLLVGTHPGITYILHRLLRLRGYELLVAEDVKKAVHLALGRRLKLVVVTPYLDDADGVSFARTLRSLTPRTPLIVSPEPFDVARILDALPDHRLAEAREPV
jgi:DNA-binding response OmpR family regulator